MSFDFCREDWIGGETSSTLGCKTANSVLEAFWRLPMPREKRDFKILCSKCGLMTTTHDDKNEYIDVISPDGETCKIISKRVITFTHESGKKCVVVIHPDISYLS